MTSVQFMSWKQRLDKARSYKALKEARQARRDAIEQILRAHSTLRAGEFAQCVERLDSGEGATIPVSGLNQAHELAEELCLLGAEVRVREMDNACYCETCNTFTVVQIAEEPPGFQVYCCASCLEIKRACPHCGGQGWLIHHRGPGPVPIDRYICDECYFICNSDWSEWTPESGRPLRLEDLGATFESIRDYLE
jgi:hypothetical protein